MANQSTHSIFLSYRRDDAPGYVARLGDDLIDAYGEVVFRDVDSILGGDEWKPVLKRQVAQANILLALIGPRWLSEIQERENADVDYVRYELNTARELKIPVIPVLVGNTTMPEARLLGDLAWLPNLQKHTLLDEQRRWIIDSKLLVKRVGELGGLRPYQQIDIKQLKPMWWQDPKWIIGAVALSIIVAITTILLSKGDTTISVDGGVGGQNITTGDVRIEKKP